VRLTLQEQLNVLRLARTMAYTASRSVNDKLRAKRQGDSVAPIDKRRQDAEKKLTTYLGTL
jgi:hypothetical protein